MNGHYCAAGWGDQVLMWLAVAGVAATPAAFAALRWLGAGYLAWLGARLLFAKRESQVPAPRQAWCHHRPLSFAFAKL